MRIWYIPRLLLVGLSALGVQTGRAAYINHSFDAAPFTLGIAFTNDVDGWRAPTSSVVVVDTKSFSTNQSVLLPEGSAISNAVAQGGPNVVWTDVRLAPHLGAAPESSLTNGASYLSYFGTNGYLHLWDGGAWRVCSNDVWNQPVTPMTNEVFATISVYQNFAADKAAVLINDRVVMQDLPIPASASAYNALRFLNATSNAWLDDAYVQTNYDGTRLTSNQNGVDGIDAAELQTYGYVARTLAVGSGPYAYASLADALAVARDRDTLAVDCGTPYTDTVTITQNLTIAGCTFTNTGVLTVLAGKMVTVSNGFTSSLMVSGTLAIAQGVLVSGATVTVAGTITVPTNNAQLLVGNLNIGGSGTVVATGGQVVDAGAGVGMSGTFTLSNTWDTAVSMGLDFIEDFEVYDANTRLQALGFRGWGASTSSVMVKAAQGDGGSKGVQIPERSVLSNRIATAQTKIWTDYHVKPRLGDAPASADTNASAFLSYVATNGLLNVWLDGEWGACSNFINGSTVAAMTTNAFMRVTVFANFESDNAAVFLDGKLARERVGFPGGAAMPGYQSFRTSNSHDAAWLDNVRITTSIPSGLTNDLDGDGEVDATEIQERDSALLWNGPRTLFRFK